MERWNVHGETVQIGGADAARLVTDRLLAGVCETWLQSSDERSLIVVTNGTRAMLLLFREPGEAGIHAGDPTADEDARSSGFILSNGQDDTYADRDTIPLDRALPALRLIVDAGVLDPAVHWIDDENGDS